jgi:diaminohydroxyphosphoribosylaminopyrimidine deaminase/5-amino-6-(5-phosphoribosylamino)uracil reductase
VLSDIDYMDRALHLAERGAGRCSPNPMVGAVIVRDGVVVGHGYHETAGEAHAEIQALEEAGDQARGATLYCTLEPCCHTGRTGPCVERVVEAGIVRTVTSTTDPNPLVNGKGIEFLRDRGLEVETGLCADAARQLNRAFFTYITRKRPFVIMKIATSLDGRIAASAGARTTLTSQRALRHAQRVRASVDAVGVGATTVLTDDPLLTVRMLYRHRPLTRVVFDRHLKVSPSAKLFTTLSSGPIVILTTRAAVRASAEHAASLEKAGATVETALDAGIASGIEHLGALGLTSLVLEGGTTLHRLALEAGVVDHAHIYVAPVTLGSEGVGWLGADEFGTAHLSGVRTQALGPDVLVEGDVYRNH